MRRSPRRQHYALYAVSLSVRLVPSVDWKTENYTTFKLRREVTHVGSNRQSNFQVKRSNWVEVTVGGSVKIASGRGYLRENCID